MRPIAVNGVVWKEGKHFIGQCPNVDVSSFGGTKKEAFANLREALELYFEDKGGSPEPRRAAGSDQILDSVCLNCSPRAR